MSRGASTKARNVGQALIANKPGRRNRKQESSRKGDRAGKGVSDDVAAKNENSSSTKNGKYDDMRNKCHRCLEPGHRWFNCTAHVIHAAKKSQNGSGEVIGCLAIGMLGKRDAVGEREQGTDGTEKWIADSGATFHMTRSADLLRDVQPSEDKVKIGNDTLVDVEGYGSLTVVFPNKAEGVTVRLDKVAYVPSLAFNLFSLMAAHTRGVGFATDDKDMSVTLADGRLKFWSDGSGYCNYGRRIDPDDDYIPFPLLVPEPIENVVQPAHPISLEFPIEAPGSANSCETEWLSSLTFLHENPMQPAHTIPLACPVIAPGSANLHDTTVDINVFHCVHGHANEFLLRETAKSLGVELLGRLRPCTGCSMAKGYRKPIANSTKSRATKKLGRVFVDLSGPKSIPSLLGKKYVMIVKDDFTRYAWVYFLERKSDAADAFRKFLADVRGDGVPSEVERVRSDNGGEFFGGEFGDVCRQYCIKQEFTNAKSPELNGVAERALGIIQNAALAARIQAPILFPHVELPPSETLWAEAVHWACEALNRTATTSNPGNKSPYEMWHGKAAPASPHPFLRPGYCRWNRPSKSFPRCESSFYLGPGIDHPRDSLRMLTRANKVVETRDVTWEAPPVMEVPPVQLQQLASPELAGAPELGGTSEQGEASELGETAELGGLDDFDSGPATRLPMLGRGIPHQPRVASPAGSVGNGGQGERGSVDGVNMPAPDATTAPSGDYLSSVSSESSVDGENPGEASSSDEIGPVTTMARTAARQLESHLVGPGDGEQLGRTRAQTRALNQDAASLVSVFGPDEGGKLIHGLLAVQEVTRKPGELPKCLVREAGPEPVSYPAACSSEYSDVWMEAMSKEFDGLVAAGTFAEVTEIPGGCNIVDAKWLYKWKGDSHGMVDRAKARMVAMGYSQVEGVDYFETFAPTASATSNRLVAAMACKLDWDLRHLDVDQAFIQSELDTDIYLRLPPGCGSVSGKVVLLNKALYGLKQSGRAWYQLLSSTLVECGFEQCLVDPCVFRLMVAGDVVAMMVFHVDDIKIAATEKVTEVVVSALNQRFPTKHLGEVEWYMGSEYKRDREKGTLEISQTQFIQSVLNRFGVSKSSPIPATPFLDLRHVSEEETVVDVPFREIVGSLMWIANQTRPDIANAVRAVARFSHDPKPIHYKAAQKILEYLNATSDLGLTFRRDSDLESVQMEFDLETYVDADYAHKAEDRRSVSGVAVCCGGTLVSWFSRTQKCVTLSTTEAEYVAMADGVKEALYVRGILAFLMPSLEPMSISVYEDNKGAIDLAKNPLSSSNSKHIDVRYHFLRELAASGDISVQYLRTEDQHADILTKAVGRESFERHRDFLLGRS